ncbi:glycosyltransferase [Polynucleobacter sp. AP-Feld-500C-C5]|uniref:glycosyltransferase n=1 Tax=Polynucleobacter sp. AP-Feld-500C-C5 TaxID=2576924 RepID=UPI001C0C39BE|nr:glycosyltransferase [Polynucleobacter sp. AP-Feld-500C-C5]MBU3632851.1 glycosyltransferase [Polynucleobacter sp. AP-Feld-500C-C5]
MSLFSAGMNETPSISVCITTYNHSQFIEQTLESVLNQQVNFPVEIIISDDCSKDSTKEILSRYQLKYPGLVKTIFNEKNIGATKNTVKILSQASGKYVALLDGDDYWKKNHKLQKQYDFLESNDDCVMCFHAVDIQTKEMKIIEHFLPVPKFRRNRSEMMDLINFDSFMATSSIVFRNHILTSFPSEYYATRGINDWPLNVLLTEHGAIGYIDESMGVYRQASSINAFTFKPIEKILKNAIVLNKQFNRYFSFRYQEIFRKKISGYYMELSKSYLRVGDVKKSRKYLECANRYRLHLKRSIKLYGYYFPLISMKNSIKNIFKL